MNLQGVNGKNVANRQGILNENAGLKDQYNWHNMLRDDDIRRQKSLLGQNTTEDLMTGVQDKRQGDLDQKKILYDSLKYSDGAGLANLVDTPAMDDLSKTPEGRKQVVETLEKTGQHDAVKRYKKKYKIA